MKLRILALLRALACPGGHRLRRDAFWVPADGHWWTSDYTCIDCGHVEVDR